ncbi:MAG TPA: hypothetical protein VFC24_10565 [Casimicrobiaceae bacterium]|nr:hypothetical protein [Casimicrobiaceae bacterium]
MTSPVNPGMVEWSGDNPGIYLKNAGGAWTALAVYFRVVTSPHGTGIGSIVLGAPATGSGYPSAPNVCISSNEPLMRYLVANFVSRFASFRAMAGLEAMTYQALIAHETSGDGRTFHQESLRSRDAAIVMRWDDLGPPFAVDVQPSMSATGQHEMYSVFLEARRGTITLNGDRLPGEIIQRDFLDRRMSTAFLAFSETWLKPPAGAA